MTVTTQFYNNMFGDIASGTINLLSNTIKAMLVNGYTFNSSHDTKSDLGAVEIPTGNGYNYGGAALSNKALTYASGKTKWDADDVVWNVSGGSVGPATGAVLYDDSSTGDKLICYIDFGTAETVASGTDFKLVFNSNGIFSIG